MKNKLGSNEFFSSVELHLYARQESTRLDPDEIDVVHDFAFHAFSAAACALQIIARRQQSERKTSFGGFA